MTSPLTCGYQANHYYKLFISWTNQNIRNTFVQRNMFDFKHIKVRAAGKREGVWSARGVWS